MKKYQVKEEKKIPSPEDIIHEKYHNFYEKPEARAIAKQLMERLENGGNPSTIYYDIVSECKLCEKHTSGYQVGRCPFPNPMMATYLCPIWPVKSKAFERKS